MDIVLNYWAILAAAVAAMLVGSIWYAKPVFGKTWMALVNMTPDKAKKGQAMAMIGMAIGALITAYILAHFVAIAIGSPFFSETSDLMQGIYTAFWAWLGFGFAQMISGPLFAKSSWTLFLINTGNMLVTLIAMGAIIGAWR